MHYQNANNLKRAAEKDGRIIKRQVLAYLNVPNAASQKCLIGLVRIAVITVGDLSYRRKNNLSYFIMEIF